MFCYFSPLLILCKYSRRGVDEVDQLCGRLTLPFRPLKLNGSVFSDLRKIDNDPPNHVSRTLTSAVNPQCPPKECLPAVHCRVCTCSDEPTVEPKPFPYNLPNHLPEASRVAVVGLAICEYGIHESFVWTVLVAVMTEMKVFRLIDRYLSIDDDVSPVTMFVQSSFIFLFTCLIIALFIFVFYTASQEGYDSFHKGVHNWLNPKTTCSQFYGYTGTVNTFNLVIDAFPITPSTGFWQRPIGLQARRLQLPFCKRRQRP